jgi:hypothetical protein
MRNADFTLHSRQALVTLGAGGMRNSDLRIVKAVSTVFGPCVEKW